MVSNGNLNALNADSLELDETANYFGDLDSKIQRIVDEARYNAVSIIQDMSKVSSRLFFFFFF